MERDGEIERILKSIAGPLRHELSVLRLMGEVPQINFVKDRSNMKSAEIDAILKTADFGEDFVPTDATLFQKTDYKLEIRLPDELREKIKELDSLEEDDTKEPLPPMRHDIFGLDHARMMNKITVSMSKSKQAWESFDNRDAPQDSVVPKESAVNNFEKLAKEAENRENFAKYLQSKNSKKFTPERKKYRNLLAGDEKHESFEYSDPIPDSDYIIEDLEDLKKQ